MYQKGGIQESIKGKEEKKPNQKDKSRPTNIKTEA